MVHSNKRTALQELAAMTSVANDHEQEVYFHTHVVHGHHVGEGASFGEDTSVFYRGQ